MGHLNGFRLGVQASSTQYGNLCLATIEDSGLCPVVRAAMGLGDDEEVNYFLKNAFAFL